MPLGSVNDKQIDITSLLQEDGTIPCKNCDTPISFQDENAWVNMETYDINPFIC